MKKIHIDDLMNAISKNDVNEVETLLSQEVEINAYHKKTGMTPLMAAAYNGNKEIVMLLISHNANMNMHSKNKEEFTALHFAVQEKKIEVVEKLIEHGANVNAKDAWGNGPLFRAAGNENMMTLLLKKGADASMQNNHGISPINSRAVGFEFIKKHLNITEDSAKTNYFSVIDAVKFKDLDTLKRLIKEGADLNAKDKKEGNTALHIAVEQDNLEVVKILLDAGAEIDVKDEYGGTPLATAAIVGNLPMTKILIEKGANSGNKDKFGNSIEQLAKNHTEILNYLKGAKEK